MQLSKRRRRREGRESETITEGGRTRLREGGRIEVREKAATSAVGRGGGGAGNNS